MNNIQVLDFDWDAGNKDKCEKHGISSKEIEAFFKQESVYIAPDIKHSEEEQRFLAIGRSVKGKPRFIAFTLRTKEGLLLIRPISARYMHDKEAKKYEEENT